MPRLLAAVLVPLERARRVVRDHGPDFAVYLFATGASVTLGFAIARYFASV